MSRMKQVHFQPGDIWGYKMRDNSDDYHYLIMSYVNPPRSEVQILEMETGLIETWPDSLTADEKNFPWYKVA